MEQKSSIIYDIVQINGTNLIKSVNFIQLHMNFSTKIKTLNTLKQMKYMGFNYIEPINFSSNNKINFQLPNDLMELKNIAQNCNLCSFSKTRTNVLFGEGNPKAKVVFINLAPNNLEDETGQIFTGKNLQMITNMITNVLNLNMEEIYFMNILKCMPNKEIRNEVEEIEICKPYIKKQLDIIQPIIVIALGDALDYLKDYFNIVELSKGKVYESNDRYIMSIHHPSFLIRNPSEKVTVLEDLKKIKVYLRDLID